MNGLFALSISNSVTEVGALAAFAALLGIAILSLLVFSQAREIKRLREWAGRAPERAAEMEQRVSADAAARVRGGAPPAPVGARVVPRKTPLVSAPVSTAVNATVAAVAPTAGAPSTAGPVAPAPSTAGPVGEVPAVTAAAGAAVVAGASSGDSNPKAAGPAAPGPSIADPAAPTPSTANPVAPTSPSAVPAVQSGMVPAQSEGPAKEAAAGGPAPVTAAARAASASVRAPLPPSPSAPAPPAGVPAPAAPAAARSMPSRTVGAPAGSSPPRSPTPSRGRPATSAATSAGALAGTRAPGVPVGGNGPKYFKPERSPRRATALIVGGVIVGVLVLVLAVSVLKGGGGSSHTTSSSPSVREAPTTRSHTTASAVASNPSETAVVVLNGTGTPDLAHHLAADLQQGGYSLASASTGVPPGTHATTVVQYTHGHRADAKAVAKALNVTHVQPIESAIASLAGSATVVVLAGADQASQLGGTQSNGEPAATGGEGAAGGQ